MPEERPIERKETPWHLSWPDDAERACTVDRALARAIAKAMTQKFRAVDLQLTETTSHRKG